MNATNEERLYAILAQSKYIWNSSDIGKMVKV